MKRSIIYALLIALSFGFVSCDNSYNNYKRSRAKIDKLLAERQFEEAREVANDISRQSVKEELLNNISYTQLNMMMEDGDYETAAALARELQQEELFYDSFLKNIRQIAKRGNYNFIFETFMDWQSPCEAKTYEENLLKNFDYLLEEHEPTGDWNGGYYSCLGGKYNWCIRPINNAIDVVLQKVMYEGNPTTIRRCLMCYKPYSVFDRKEKTNEFSGKEKNEEYRYYKFYFKMQNTAKEDAEKMLLEAKIEY